MDSTEETRPIRPRFDQRGEKIAAVVLIVVLVGVLLFVLNRSRPLNLAAFADAFPTLIEGAKLTLLVTVLAYLTGMGLGFWFGWMRTLRNRILRAIAAAWTESFRGTPLFVQLLFLLALLSYYNPGDLPVSTRVFLTGYLALMLNTSGYQSEIFRAGLQSVAAGQVEAAKSVGFGYWGAMRNVIVPQALRLVTLPLTNEFISLLKASSLLFVIGVQELTYEGRLLTFRGNLVEVYAALTILYLLMTVPLGKLVSWIERRRRIPGLGMQPESGTGPLRGLRGTTARVLGFGRARTRSM
jgi:polar amino acid transport system permease protein